jgi:hypothetical protein
MKFTNIFNLSITVKHLLFIIASTSTTVGLLFILYTQTTILNIQQEEIQSLTIQIEAINSAMQNVSEAHRLSPEIDAEKYRAITERNQFYAKVALSLVAGSVLVYGLFWSVGYTAAPWTLVKATFFQSAQYFGYLNEVETYSKTYKQTFWETDIINKGQDMIIRVKLPGQGDYVNAMDFILNNVSTAKSPVLDALQPHVLDVLLTPALTTVLTTATNPLVLKSSGIIANLPSF